MSERKSCKHPKERRELLAGYDVTCGDCGEVIGRVTLLSHAVLSGQEALAVLRWMPDNPVTMSEYDARSELMRCANRWRTP